MIEEQIKAEVSNIIQFGGYDWRVLDIQGGKALLLSDKVLESRAYHRSHVDGIIWAECDLRAYLNGEFYDSLGDDKAHIAETKAITGNNPWFGTNGGVKTDDKIFLLSIEEVVEYFGDSGQLENRPDSVWGMDDRYSAARIASNENGDASWWWLRSPGLDSGSAATVSIVGSVGISGIKADYDCGVRPALWLNQFAEHQNPKVSEDAGIYMAKFFFAGNEDDKKTLKNILTQSTADEFNIETVYGVEITKINEEDTNEWIICYSNEDQDLFESVLGEDAMLERVNEISILMNIAPKDIMVFSRVDEFR